MELDRQISRIEVSEVEIGDRTRGLNESKVDELVSSILVSGLMNPIWVSCVRDENRRPVGHRLISGNHRLAAAKKLDWEFIDARIVDCDEREARLMEISENLHRAELTVGERADQIAEWIRLTAPDGISGQLDQQIPPRGRGRPEGGISEAARTLPVAGETEEARRNTVRRAVRIASIAPEAREAAREAGLDDNQSALLRIASAVPETQVEAVAAIVEARAAPRQTTPETTPESSSEVDALFNRFLSLDRERRSEFYALIIGAFMPQTTAAAVEQPRSDHPRPKGEALNVQRKLLEAELVVALDAATKENPAWGLTHDGWTAVQMLLGVVAYNKEAAVEAAAALITLAERAAADPVEVEVVTGIEPEPVAKCPMADCEGGNRWETVEGVRHDLGPCGVCHSEAYAAEVVEVSAPTVIKPRGKGKKNPGRIYTAEERAAFVAERGMRMAA
jgi:hypothetical protein